MTISCEKDFALKVNPAITADLLAWWPFEDAAPPWIDTLNLRPMADDPINPQVTVAGKVGDAVRLIIGPGITVSLISNVGVTPAASSGSVSFSAWVNRTPTGALGFPATITLSLYDVFPNEVGRVVLTATSANVTLQLYNAAIVLQLSLILAGITDSNWHFICGYYDRSSGRIGLKVDNNLKQETIGTFVLPDIYTVFRSVLSFRGAVPGPLDQNLFDEFNVWDGVVSDSQIADLWNGGAGRTYP